MLAQAGRGDAALSPDSAVAPSSAAPVLETELLLPPDGVRLPALLHVRISLRCDARDVCIVWGLDHFQKVPAVRPPGTFLTFNDSHLNTPMTHVGDEFVVEFDVEENVDLEYGFEITPEAPNALPTWRGSNSQGDYFSTRLTRATARSQRQLSADEWAERTSAASVGGDQPGASEANVGGSAAADADAWQNLHIVAHVPARYASVRQPSIKFQIRFRNPTADEVTLMWGFNNWAPAEDISKLPPGTTLKYFRTHCYTPMKKEGDAFVFDFEAADNTQLDYAFITTRIVDGQTIESWHQDNRTGKPYTAMLRVVDADEVVTDRGSWPAHVVILLALSGGMTLFFAVRLAWHLSRKKPSVPADGGADDGEARKWWSSQMQWPPR